MGLFSKDIKTFDDLFVHQLQDIYYAEKQLVMSPQWPTRRLRSGAEKKLPGTSRSDQGPRRAARAGLQDAQRRGQGRDLSGDRRHHQGGKRTKRRGRSRTRKCCDAALINAAQAAERYEINPLWHAGGLGKRLGREDCASLLKQTLDEEKNTKNQRLTKLAESKINARAA